MQHLLHQVRLQVPALVPVNLLVGVSIDLRPRGAVVHSDHEVSVPLVVGLREGSCHDDCQPPERAPVSQSLLDVVSFLELVVPLPDLV
jgi:hypothetical protein